MDAYQKIIDKAASALRRDIRQQGLSDQLRVSTEPVTRAALQAVARPAGGGH
jgi:hypothetical protein